MNERISAAILAVSVAASIFIPVAAQPQEGTLAKTVAQQRSLSWQADALSGWMHLNRTLLEEVGVALEGGTKSTRSGAYQQLQLRPTPGDAISFRAPFGKFEGLTGGSGGVTLSATLSSTLARVDLTQLYLRPSSKPRVSFEFVHPNLGTLFTGELAHSQLFAAAGNAEFRNMDLKATKALADALRMPMLAGLIIGGVDLSSNVVVPPGALLKAPGSLCEGRPLWVTDGAETDVLLKGIPTVQRMRNEGEFAVVAPSAELKNSPDRFADAPWFQKFSPPSEPYSTDQHPFLVWSMFREHEDRFEQSAISAIKHAFFTINQSCQVVPGGNDYNTCDSVHFEYFGHVLWPGCEDVYSVFNNDSGNALGPRGEVNPLTGVWDNCGSFFDPACIGSQTESSGNDGMHRLLLPLADFEAINEGARFWLDAWYVVRDDIDIFNTMGYREVSPKYEETFPGSGEFVWVLRDDLGDFSLGSPLDNWVPAGTQESREASERLASESGHVQLAAKVTLEGGIWRYSYALMNFDFEGEIDSLSIQLSDFLVPAAVYFHDADENPDNNWTFEHANGAATWTAPAGGALPWGQLHTFSFDLDAGPFSSRALISVDAGGSNLVFNSLAPDYDLLFVDGSEP